jgi:hypothetical protein
VNLPTLIETLVTLVFAGKFLVAAKFIGYRLASWMGVGFFYKKGKHSGKKRFYWAAFTIWLTSWGLFLYFSPKIIMHAIAWLRSF